MRVGDNGGRMCWCAAGGWGGTMDGLVSPLADWFEMAPLSLSPWGVPLSRFWFPLLTNSKQKSISFSRGRKNIDPCFSWGKWLKNLFARDDWLCNSPSTLYVFFPSLGVLFMCSLYWPPVDSGMLNDPSFSDSSVAGAPVGSLEAALRPGSLILKYTEMPSQAGLKSVWCRPWVPSLDGPLLSVTLEELSFLFLSSLFLFSPLWKDSLTNYDSWVEGLSLFTLQRQTCESWGARDVISVSTVHLLFCLWCVKVLGFPELNGHVSVMHRWLNLIRPVGEMYRLLVKLFHWLIYLLHLDPML